MSQLTINLPDHLRAIAEARAAESGHASLEDYVQSLIRDDASAPPHLQPTSLAALEDMIAEGLNSPAREMTAADWEAKERRLLSKHGRQKAG